MIIVGENGDYEVIEGTRTLKTSDHPVFQAQIELHLAFQPWIGTPNAPQPLEKFNRTRQSEQRIDLYQKELTLFLQKYSPEDVERAVNRSSAVFTAKIREDAFSG